MFNIENTSGNKFTNQGFSVTSKCMRILILTVVEYTLKLVVPEIYT